MEITDELRVIVEAEVEKAIANFRKLDDSVGNTEKKTEKLSDAIDKISGKAMLLSTAVAGAGIAAIKFAGDNESLKTSLEGLLKSTDKANQIFAEWNEQSKETPLEMTDFATAGKMLLAFRVSADDVTDTVMRLGDVAAGTSKNVGEMGSTLTEIAEIYGKAKVQGRLFAEDINQFQGRGIPVVQELAKQFGVSESAVRDLVASGKVGFPELEKAFESMTSKGGMFEGQLEKLADKTMGKFSTATDNARMAAASFGDVMLPMANDFLDASSDVFAGLQDMDDGTKRFIISFGGVVAISGPAILAIKSINVAMAALAANPAMLGITATIVGVGLLAGVVDKYNHQLEDSVSALSKNQEEAVGLVDSWSDLNDEKILDRKTTDKLIELYPKLSDKLGDYKTTAGEAKEAIKSLTAEQTKNAVQGQVTHLNRLLDQISSDTKLYQDAKDAYKESFLDLQSQLLAGKIDDATFSYQLSQSASQTNVYNLESNIKNARETFKKSLDEINRDIANTGYMLDKNLKLVEIPVEVKITDPDTGSSGASDVKKKWQAWFEEITNVDAKKFGESGTKAGQLYIADFEAALNGGSQLSAVLGESVDLSSALESQREEIKKTLTSLLSIDPNQIDDTFEFKDESIKALVAKFKDLGAVIQKLDYEKEFDGLNTKISDVSKSEDELSFAAYKAQKYTDEQARALVALHDELSKKEILADYAKQVDELGKSESELTRERLIALKVTPQELAQFDEMVSKLKDSDGIKSFQIVFTDATKDMLDSWKIVDESIKTTLADMNYQLANISFDAALDGLHDIGEALGEGADGGEALREALANYAQQILDNLPMMFLQAGLQLIANGNWPMGLGFIAAAGSTAFIGGFTAGVINSASEDTTENALGGVYGQSGIVPFAKGGLFSNSIVDSPTLFKFANGTGLMGEAGPEAIIPLKRGTDGSLGIASVGGAQRSAPSTSVTIINNTGAAVSQKETTGSDGSKQLEIVVGQIINSHLSRGRADGVLGSRYGTRVKGIG